jgi:uncharacterized protein YqfA (UPF0365 family)
VDRGVFAGVRVGLGELVGMRLRKVSPAAVVRPMIAATKAGLDLSTRELEAHYLAGGHVDRVVKALISADKANLGLSFEQAAAIDLAGRDVLEAVKVSVNPKVIDTPRVAAMAKDGIQMIATARVTVRANINRLVGGAGEDTILARVGEGIVSTIGSADSHKAVLENPDNISKTVLAKGLDAGTAFEILSIDIADVDVGKNIGAELQTDQAEADKRIAQAKAEERRAMAVAVEQENRAKVQEMRARVVRGRGAGAAGHGGGVPLRQPRHHGLPALPQRRRGHADAKFHRRRVRRQAPRGELIGFRHPPPHHLHPGAAAREAAEGRPAAGAAGAAGPGSRRQQLPQAAATAVAARRAAGGAGADDEAAAGVLPDDLWEILTGRLPPVDIRRRGSSAGTARPRSAGPPPSAADALVRRVKVHRPPAVVSMETAIEDPELRRARFQERLAEMSAPALGGGPRGAHEYAFSSPDQLRRAIIMAEILGRPRGLE